MIHVKTGIILDNTLNFKDYVSYVTKKMIKLFSLMYKIVGCYRRKCLLMFYISYAKTAFTYGLMACGALTKTKLLPMGNAQRRLFRLIFHKEFLNSLQEFMGKHHLQTIYELFLSQLFSGLFRQIRGISPFNHLRNIFYSKKSLEEGERKFLYLISTAEQNLCKDHYKYPSLRYVIGCIAQIW